MPSNPSILTVSGSVGTAVYSLDWDKRTSFNYGVQTIASSSASTYNIELSNSPIGPALLSSQATWASSFLSGASSNNFLQVTTPAMWLRLNVTAGTSLSVVTATVVSAG